MPHTADADCQIVVEGEVQLGTFANAFRVVEAVGGDCFLDFLVYSAHEERATVRARIRVEREFLTSICEVLSDTITHPASSAQPELIAFWGQVGKV